MDERWLANQLLLLLLGFGSSAASRSTPVHKVVMTQRGYIQFLKWDLIVPELEQFTYCLWINSGNLTFTNSIFSYSKNESERLIRSWITPHGRSMHLQIDKVEVLTVPVNFHQNRWYHICHSWDNADGQSALWINGDVRARNLFKELIGHKIPANGELVVGQDYTDFNKGLEEGIEGSVLGFNLLLASGTRPVWTQPRFRNNERGLLADCLSVVTSRNLEIESAWTGETLGEYLVKAGYRYCKLGRGSPFIRAKLLLVSWTRTPVKVFGGAIIKNVRGSCGSFT